MSFIVIACGGTGGHLSPGISLAETLTERGHSVTLLVSRKDIDAKLLAKYPHLKFERVPGAGFSRGPVGFLKFLFSQAHSVAYSAGFVLRERPSLYLSFGGFLTAGMALACRARGIPVVLHEANRVPGKSIRWMAGLANRVYLPPGIQLQGLQPGVLRHAGFPVRKEIVPMSKAAARAAMGLPAAGRLLLVLGGSQGARSLNNWAESSLDRLAEAGVSLLCVTGPGKGEGRVELRRTPSGAELAFRFLPFCDRMAAALSAADLVVSRAGAGSLAEFAACGLPAILVPYPLAADGHQDANARLFELRGCGFAVSEHEISRLTDEALRAIGDDELLSRMRANLSVLAFAQDWRPMVDEIVALAQDFDDKKSGPKL